MTYNEITDNCNNVCKSSPYNGYPSAQACNESCVWALMNPNYCSQTGAAASETSSTQCVPPTYFIGNSRYY